MPKCISCEHFDPLLWYCTVNYKFVNPDYNSCECYSRSKVIFDGY